MPQGLSLPYRFTPETTADANQVNADLDAIEEKFEGNIVDGDIAADAGIDGNKLSQQSGKQLPEAALGSNAASDRVLASSLTSDTLRAVSGDHIKALTGATIARILPASAGSPVAGGIGVDKLSLTIHDVPMVATLTASTTRYTVSCWAEITTGNWRGQAVPIFFAGAGPASVWPIQVVTPTVTFPSATYALLNIFPISLVLTGGITLNWSVRFIFLKLTSN